ncbi:MAG: aminotransferase class I/II-fold pyridoxal phosphate-dependent enzyme [Candidatus Omnitrophota bacterium]|nr:MAG: aminotransferase class I/II-fold pyridoxal phosphate-dependent enzyme [Candidatus Omnitrophota bacterium]
MISKIVEQVSPSGIREFFDLVLGMPEVISLGVGEPDFISPWRVRERAITALEEGMTSYTSNQGLFVLRRAISNHLKKKYSLAYNPEEEILITAGVSEGFDLAVRTVVEPKDKVIVVSPYYVAYPALVQICSAKVLYLTTRQEDGFKIDPKQLSKLLSQNPKAIILNYPSNPTGVTYSYEELKEIWRLLSKKEVIVISDEIYEELTYEGSHHPFASLSQKAKMRTVFLNGFSKGYAMTGFRVGYACANRRIISAMNKIHSYSALCAPIISQLAAVEALQAQRQVNQMRNEYKRRRDFIVKELNRVGLSTVMPEGAFYCFSSLKKLKIKSMEFAKKLLYDQKVAVVPGTAFGKEFDCYVRISYANSLDNLKESIVRIEALLSKIC